MVMKAVSGPRCMRHQIECTYNCGWCSKPICEECLTVTGGKKYCDKCWAKKQQMTPAKTEPVLTTERPKIVIRNVDTSLDPKIAEQKRIELPNKKKVDPSIFEI